MHIYLIAVGTRVPAWVAESFSEYNKRLPREFRFNLIEVTPAARNKNNSTTNTIAEEQKRIFNVIPKGSIIIALDESGKQFSTKSLAGYLENWSQQGRDVCFIIGGADGLGTDIIKSADLLWSLSRLTFPHMLVRVVLAEQIYRAWSILNNHPYHRE